MKDDQDKKRRVILRVILLLIGVVLVALGIALSVKSELGVSAISSFPYVISVFTGVNLSIMLFIHNIVLVLIECLLLGRDFKFITLAQIPFAFMLSTSLNVTERILTFSVSDSAYWVRFAVMLGSICSFAVGIYLLVEANLVVNIPEGLNRSITNRFQVRFSRVKIGIDLTHVGLSALLGLIFFGRIIGVREGTLFSATLTGWLIGVIPVSFKKWLHRKCYGETADMSKIVR